MKRRRWILLAVLGFGLTAVLIAALPKREPEYQGKKLNEWLGAYMYAWNNNPTAQAQAADAVRHIGTNALPFLVRWIDYERPKWRTKLADTMVRLHVPFARRAAERLAGSREYRASKAQYGFEILGEEATPAVPALIQMAGDWKSQSRCFGAMWALASVGKEGLPTLVAVATNTTVDPSYRCNAAHHIGTPVRKLGTNASWAVRALVPCLEDTNVAECIIEALSPWKLAADEVVPALTKCLKSPDLTVRVEAAAALGNFGPEASSAIPELLLAARENQEWAGGVFTNVLHRIAPNMFKEEEH